MIDQTADKAPRGHRPASLARRRRGGGGVWRVLAWALVVVAALAAVDYYVWPQMVVHRLVGERATAERAAAPARQGAQAGRGGRFAGGGPMPVSIYSAAKAEMPIVFGALGTVTPLATVTVKAQVAGQLTQVAFQEGQLVKKGDFLAEIDPRPYQAALDQAMGQLQRDQALLRNAEVDLQRYRTLMTQDSIARQQLDTQDALVRQYVGTVKIDQGLVDNARINLGFTRVVAPINGRVGLRQVDQGNNVQVGDTTGLAVITQVQPITVIFTLPEDSLQPVLKRLRGGATLDVTAFDRAQKVKLATGKLTTIDNQMDVATGTFKLRAQFDNEDEALFPNQFVNIQLLVDVQKDNLVVPTSAIQRGAPGTFVYTLQADETVKVQPVTLGPQSGERVAIASGLNAGDKVVIDGADKLRDGAKVTLPEEAAATPQAGQARREGAQRGENGQRGEGQGRRRQPQ